MFLLKIMVGGQNSGDIGATITRWGAPGVSPPPTAASLRGIPSRAASRPPRHPRQAGRKVPAPFGLQPGPGPAHPDFQHILPQMTLQLAAATPEDSVSRHCYPRGALLSNPLCSQRSHPTAHSKLNGHAPRWSSPPARLPPNLGSLLPTSPTPVMRDTSRDEPP